MSKMSSLDSAEIDNIAMDRYTHANICRAGELGPYTLFKRFEIVGYALLFLLKSIHPRNPATMMFTECDMIGNGDIAILLGVVLELEEPVRQPTRTNWMMETRPTSAYVTWFSIWSSALCPRSDS
jgi:hypothetical protein